MTIIKYRIEWKENGKVKFTLLHRLTIANKTADELIQSGQLHVCMERVHYNDHH